MDSFVQFWLTKLSPSHLNCTYMKRPYCLRIKTTKCYVARPPLILIIELHRRDDMMLTATTNNLVKG